MPKLKFSDIEYDFGSNIDAFIFAAFLKEFLYLGNPTKILSVRVRIIELHNAGASSDKTKLNKPVLKTLHLFHPDKFKDNFKTEAKVFEALMSYKYINKHTKEVATQNKAPGQTSLSPETIIANSIAKFLNAAKENGSLLITVNDETSTVFSDFITAYCNLLAPNAESLKPDPKSLDSEVSRILAMQAARAKLRQQIAREQAAREQAAQVRKAHEQAAAQERAIREQAARQQAERERLMAYYLEALSAVVELITDPNLTVETRALFISFGLRIYEEYITVQSTAYNANSTGNFNTRKPGNRVHTRHTFS